MDAQRTNKYWKLTGRGMDAFGENDTFSIEALPHPGPGEVLARVEACAICASDAKMIRLGTEYPLFRERDLATDPARLGHELSLVVEEAGPGMEDAWPRGMRFGVQPDAYLAGRRYCIGVNRNGGMAEHILLGAEVFDSDKGACAFPVPAGLSHAAVAQTEPLACIEASFMDHARTDVTEGDRVLVYVAPDAEGSWDLTALPMGSDVTLCREDGGAATLELGDVVARRFASDSELTASTAVILIGNPDTAHLERLADLVEPHGIFAWLGCASPDALVPTDIAKVHYDTITFCGSTDRTLSGALAMPRRNDYLPGGTLLISGGAGAMGRLQVMRALQHEAPPARVVVLGRTHARLDALLATFSELSTARNIPLVAVSMQDRDAAERLRSVLGPDGASDVVVCAPGPEPVCEAVPFLAPDGMLVLFAGISYGTKAPLPIGAVAAHQLSLNGYSGSDASDQLRVLERILAGSLDPDSNVAAIVGFNGVKRGLEAVRDGRFAGKVIIYPQLTNLPLTPISELSSVSQEVADAWTSDGWSIEAERLLYAQFGKTLVEG